ncbi:hypothetical protein VKT23_008184 [Stygiomarasmius scandens]|uniref:Uncharacterized protein n=1 Tax=Marasmiellus scandens TaxID=2682957 RepID=A0ABR1JK10_9AGAR
MPSKDKSKQLKSAPPTSATTAPPGLHSSGRHVGVEDNDNDEENVDTAAPTRQGRPKEKWTNAQFNLLRKQSEFFMACVEDHKEELLNKTNKSAWPKPLTARLEEIQTRLEREDAMKPIFLKGLIVATEGRPLSQEDHDLNSNMKSANIQNWKKVSSANRPPDLSPTDLKGDACFELVKKALIANRGPRDIFVEERLEEIKNYRDQLLIDNPQLSKQNNGVAWQRAVSEMWRSADQTPYIERSTLHPTDLASDREKMCQALFWFLNALSPKLGEVEMMLVIAYRNEGDGVDLQSDKWRFLLAQYSNWLRQVDATCKSQSNLGDSYTVEYEQTWKVLCEEYKEWAGKHLPKRFHEPETKQLLDISTNAEGVPVFPSTSCADLNIMRNTLQEFFKVIWAYSWPADMEFAAIPWSRISQHPEDYYDPTRLPYPLKSPESMNMPDVLQWFMLLQQSSTPFMFYPKAEIARRLRDRQKRAEDEVHAGEEVEDNPPTPHSSSPPPEVIDSDCDLERARAADDGEKVEDNRLTPHSFNPPTELIDSDRNLEQAKPTGATSDRDRPSDDLEQSAVITAVVPAVPLSDSAISAQSTGSHHPPFSVSDVHTDLDNETDNNPSTSADHASLHPTQPQSGLKIKLPPISKSTPSSARKGNHDEEENEEMKETNGKSGKGRKKTGKRKANIVEAMEKQGNEKCLCMQEQNEPQQTTKRRSVRIANTKI